MNLIDELRSLDPRDPGRWPLAVRAGAVGSVLRGADRSRCIYFFVWDEQRPELQQREDEEQKLRQEFKTKHAKAVNLERLQAAAEGHRALLRRAAAAAAGQDRGAQPAGGHLADRPVPPAWRRSCSSPRPSRRRTSTPSCPSRSASPAAITSSASSSAASRRCRASSRCTTSRSSRTSKDAYDQLQLELTAKTYRYLDEDEIAAGEADKKKAAQHRRRARLRQRHERDDLTCNTRHELLPHRLHGAARLRCATWPHRLLERATTIWRASSTTRRRSRAAASSRCRRSSRTRPSSYAASRPALAVPAEQPGFGRRACRAASGSEAQPRIPRAVLARHFEDGRHAASSAGRSTASCRPRTAWCTGSSSGNYIGQADGKITDITPIKDQSR